MSRRIWFVIVWTEQRESDPLKDGDFLGWCNGKHWSEYIAAKRPGRAIALGIVASGFTGKVRAEVEERHRAKRSRKVLRDTERMCWGTRRERQARPYRCLLGVVHDGRRAA